VFTSRQRTERLCRLQISVGVDSTGGGLRIDTPDAYVALNGRASNQDQRPLLRGVSHLSAFVITLPLGVALAASADGTMARGAAIVFSASVAAMFGVSSLFHRIAWKPRAKRWLGRIDHTMIYALIAGTYTPIALLVLHHSWRGPILATVWGGGFVAAAARFVWHGAPKWVVPATSVALGWVAVIVLPQIVAVIGIAGALLLVGGGIAYTVGAVVYTKQWPDPRPRTFGYHELFHSLVIVAVACQYATVAFFVLPQA
jgi:hemolysin III